MARRISLISILIGSLVLPGCAPRLGYKTIPRDRFDYSTAITSSWKEQMLLNLVKVRYVDPPVFVDIQQIVSQYTFERSGTINAPHWDGGVAESAANISGRWAESPTITFNPMTGENYIKSLIRPVTPENLLGLVEAGWPIDSIMAIGVKSINGIHAPSHVLAAKHEGDPTFYRILALLRQLQQSDAVALQVEGDASEEEKSSEDKDDSSDDNDKDSKNNEQDSGHTIVIFRTRELDEAGQRASEEVRRLLHLSPDAMQFSLVFGGSAKNDHEIAMLTRSMLEILGESSFGVEVPEADVTAGRVTTLEKSLPSDERKYFPLLVHSSESRPHSGDAFVLIRYRTHYFWIDDRDLQSKRSLGFLMALFTLLESGTTAAPPTLTISKP